MSFVDLRLLIIFLYRQSFLVIFTIVLYVLRRLTSSDYLLVSSILSCNLYHCVVCLSFVDLRLLIIFWYRQSCLVIFTIVLYVLRRLTSSDYRPSCLVIFTIVLYVLRRLTSSDYLLVSSILSCNLYHCVVCPSSTYVFCLPFGIVNLVL